MDHLKKISPTLHSMASKVNIHAPTYINYVISHVMMPKEVKRMGLKTTNLQALINPNSSASNKSKYKSLEAEYREVLSRLVPYKNTPLHRVITVHDGTITREAGLLLYGLIRERKPSTVLETGVYNGFSTAIILSALNKNKKGELYSTDIKDGVGRFVKNMDTHRWHKCIGSPKNILKKTLKKIHRLDMFVHDSDHSYENMTYEFNQAYKKMKGRGIIMSDDVDMNNAFWDFSSTRKLHPKVVYSPIKLFGVVFLNKGK